MGTYLSVPFVAKKTVACEPATKQDSTEQAIEAVTKTEVKEEITQEVTQLMQKVVENLEVIQQIKEEAPVKEEKKAEPPVQQVKKEEEEVVAPVEEEKKEEEKKEEQKMSDQTLKECMEIEATIAKVSVPDLKIKIPLDDEIAENITVIRAPEFRNQFNSESHAIKKFNKKHRRH
uniref:Uncharacterized protein n=1 Tax=viral metagenome TaxID=1070528 RepID=A0A6C0KUI5_9ZZZZ